MSLEPARPGVVRIVDDAGRTIALLTRELVEDAVACGSYVRRSLRDYLASLEREEVDAS